MERERSKKRRRRIEESGREKITIDFFLINWGLVSKFKQSLPMTI